MRKIYTQRLKTNLLGLFLTVFGFASLNAQTTVELTAPSSVAGTQIQVAYGSFGAFVDATPTTGELVYLDVNTACDPILEDLTDKIVLVIDPIGDSCANSQVAYNAQVAGAKAVIMGYARNVADGSLRTLQFISLGGAFASDVTIPFVMMLGADWEPIAQILMTGTETVEVSISMVDQLGGATVVYDEQFDGGLNGWVSESVSTPDSNWEWSPDGGSDGLVFFVNSPSARANGAAIFDAAQWNFNEGGPEDYTARLTSPSIDVSDHEVLYLSFYQNQFRLNARAFPAPQCGFEFSTDDGNSWSAIQEIETENVFTAAATNVVHTEYVRLLLEGLNFTENLRLRFTWDGDYYFWGLDDIRLSVPPTDELAIESTFYPLLHYATPEAHIITDTMGFQVTFLNGGLNDQMNFEAKVEVLDAADNVMVSRSTTLNLPAFARDTVTFQNWGPSLVPGDYRLVYTLDNPAVTDEFPGNNISSAPFVITEDVFAQELADQAGVNRFLTNGAGNPWTYYFGGFFTTSALSPACNNFNGVKLAVGATDGELNDEDFQLYLLRWNDLNDNYPQFTELTAENGTNPIDLQDNFEVVAISLFSSAGRGLANNQLIDLNVADGEWVDEFGSPLSTVTLDPGTYALVGEFAGSAIGISVVNSQNLSGTPSVLYNYQDGETWSSGFVNNLYPVLRANVSCFSGTDLPQLDDVVAKVFPTITSDVVNIELNFNEFTDAHIYITDMNGRVQTYLPTGEVSTFSHTQNVSAYAAGNYIVNIQTAVGQKQVPFTVIK